MKQGIEVLLKVEHMNISHTRSYKQAVHTTVENTKKKRNEKKSRIEVTRNHRSTRMHIFYALVLLCLSANVEIVSSDQGCPENCTCFVDRLFRETAACENISSVPEGIPNDTLHLYLLTNKIKQIPARSFLGLPLLRYLKLQYNKIDFVHPEAFKGLGQLTHLQLHNNMIPELREGLFNETKELLTLSLGVNKIKVVDPDTFKGLDSLRFLYLQENKIAELENGVFSSGSIVTLNLTRNRISKLGVGVFNNLKTAVVLYLSDNIIRIIDPGTFFGMYTCSYLDLSKNNLTVLQKGTFRGLSYLEILFLSDNKISELGEGIFNDSRRIHTLRLSKNKIKIIHPGTFDGLNDLQTVYLDNNRLSSLVRGVFSGLGYLTYLYLHSNDIMTLPSGYFTGLNTLVFLTMNYNQFTDFPELGDGPKLQTLFFANNKLKVIPDMKFQNFIQTVNIFLDNNNIVHIYNFSFYGLVRVESISLSNNPLTVVEEGAFLSLPKLKLVNLLGTQIGVPVTIWPLKKRIKYTISYSSKSKVVDIIVQVKGLDGKNAMTTMGYICEKVWFWYNCHPCYRGSFKSDLRPECEECPPGGFYQDEMGYSGKKYYGLGCKLCPRGTYVTPEMAPGKSQTECQSCKEGTNTKVFAGFRACKCSDNHYRLHRFKSCITCTKGQACANDSIDLAAGYFWIWKSKESQQMYTAFKKDLSNFNVPHTIEEFKDKIPEPYACPFAESCLGGTDSLCKEGYTGPLCAVCNEGYYNMMAICRKCPTLPWIIVQACVVVLGLFFIVFFVWRQAKKSDGNNKARSMTDIILARLKIVIGFYQVSSSTFGSFSYIKWPGPILAMTVYARIVQLNLLQIVPINCIKHSMKTDAYTQFMASVIITGSAIMIGILSKYLIEWFTSKKVSEDERTEKIKQYKYTCYRFVSLVIFITFPSTCYHVFQMLPDTCHKICSYGEHNCKSYLRADYSVECDTTRHTIYGNLSRLAIVYCVGIPLVVLFILKRSLKNSESSSLEKFSFMKDVLRFMYENYCADCWFWEIVELFRKIFFSAVLLLLSAEGRTSLGMTAMFSGLYSILFAFSKPMEDNFEHWLQLISLMASSVNLTIGMLLQIPRNEISSGVNQEGDDLIITIVLVSSNVLVVTIVAVKYISSILKTIKSLKNEPKCSVSCCLEILQLVTDAHGDATDIIDEQGPTKVLNDKEKGLGDYAETSTEDKGKGRYKMKNGERCN